MARLARASAVYEAFDHWVTRSILEDDSIFAPGTPIWTVENINLFKTAFTGSPREGGESSFEEKFEAQLKDAGAHVQMLGAEMLWVLLLFARKAVSMQRKRELVVKVWSWSGRPLSTHTPLTDAVLAGIGNAGTAFNTQRDRELDALIQFVLVLKAEREGLRSISPLNLAEIFDRHPRSARRNIRNILLHLLRPDDFERVASASHKVRIVRAFADLLRLGSTPPSKPLSVVDVHLRAVRAQLEHLSPGKAVDFYESPWRERWIEEPSPGGGTTKRPARKGGGGEGLTSYIRLTKVLLTAQNSNDEARAGLWLAREVATRFGDGEVSPALLFGAYLALGASPQYGSHSGAALNRNIEAALRNRSGPKSPSVLFWADLEKDGLSWAIATPLPPDPLPDVELGVDVAPIFDAARALAARVAITTPQRLSPRHVLAAMLTSSFAKRVEELGLDPAALRKTLLKAVLDWREEENRDEWRRILEGGQEAVPPPDVEFYAGYSGDAIPSGKTAAITEKDDRLDVMKDVTALCEVLAAQQTDPPLAVGLFGDWGTGKSFFMELMRQKITELGKKNRGFYCSDVVQVWFNAWHYMDTNLWASLASRVFEELAAHFERREIPAEQRNRLFEELEKTRGVLADTVAERTAAEDRRKAITREKEEQAGAVTTIAARAWRAASAALAADPEVQRNLRNARQKLGLDVVETDLAAVRVQAQQIRSLGGRIAAAGRTLARRPAFWLLGVAIFVAVTCGAWWLIAHATLFERASTAVRVVVAALAGLAAGAAPVLAQVSRGLAWLEDVLARLRQQQVVEEQRETQAFEEARARLAEREREAQERVDALTREIDELRAGRRLHRFIVERHASSEYRQHLGLVNLIRNDFEKLSELLSQSRSERKAKDSNGTAAQPAGEASGATPADAQPSAGAAEGENQPPPPLPPIDRIILYIDDLDRCPEDRVVEVLQAVHLLLAFPLFVVVVGVDAGWLVLSLQDHYATLRGRAGESKEAGKPREDEWNTTPQNYLEKIFQIPFTLRPMGSAGFGNLVESLLPAAAAEPAAETSQGAERAASAGKPAPGAETLTRPHADADGDAGDDEPLPDVDDEDDSDGEEDEGSDEEEKHDPPLIPANPQGLTVEKWERDFVARLHPLIASPRALKRFTNVYRFLRVQRRGADLHRFRGSEEEPGEFQVVALLLAVIVGYPAEAPQLLRAVLTSPGKPWWTLVDEFEAAPAAPHADDGNRGRATLREALLEVKRTVQMPERPPEVFAQWAREVARFSFQSGRILSLRDQRGDARTDANAETAAAAPG